MNDNTKANDAAPKINYGIIDIGTNSTRMLIFRVDEEGELVRVNKSVRYTRMGQGVNQTHHLHPDAIKRNLDALGEYKDIAMDYEVQEMYIFGTSAMRDADNSQEFIQMAKEKLDFDICVVSGEEEAKYGFLGVSQCFEEPILIFDIGGGSTELICGNGKTLEKMKSLNMGCVRSTETFIELDPPSQMELMALSKNATEQIEAAIKTMPRPKSRKLVGIGGTATTLSTINQALKTYDSEKVHQSVITHEALDSMIRRLAALSLEERQQIVGLEAKRADIIIAGACILRDILEVLGADSFVVCEYDNLEGAAYQHFIAKN